MRRGFFAVAVLAAAVFVACPKSSPGPQVAGAQRAGSGLLKSDCATTACPDGGTGCLTLSIEYKDGSDAGDFSGSRRFNPPPGSSGWSMCTGQELVLESQVEDRLCFNVIGLKGNTTSIRRELSDEGLRSTRSLDKGQYCVSVCKDREDAGCSEGCKDNDCTREGPDTIRGNLDVISKPPEDVEDAGTP